MPFRSEKQRRYLWKNHPKIAKDWTDTYGSKPQPKKKAEGGISLKNKDRLSAQDIKRAKKATELFGKSPSYLKGKEKAKERKESFGLCRRVDRQEKRRKG